MAEPLASYTVAGEQHLIELVELPAGRLVLDRCGSGRPGVVAELDRCEGREHALAVLHGEGAYLERVRAGERGLCRPLADDELPARGARRQEAA